MTATITTTLTQEELAELISNAVAKAMSDFPKENTRSEIPITRKQLMERLNVSTEGTIIRLEKKKLIPYMRLGGRILYDYNAVIKALEKNKEGKR